MTDSWAYSSLLARGRWAPGWQEGDEPLISPLMKRSSFLSSTLQGIHTNKSRILFIRVVTNQLLTQLWALLGKHAFQTLKDFLITNHFLTWLPTENPILVHSRHLHWILPVSVSYLPQNNTLPKCKLAKWSCKSCLPNTELHEGDQNDPQGAGKQWQMGDWLSSLMRKQSFQRKILSWWQDRDFNTEGV